MERHTIIIAFGTRNLLIEMNRFFGDMLRQGGVDMSPVKPRRLVLTIRNIAKSIY
jgi:hypothetical protein